MSRVPVLAALCAALVLVPSAAAKPPAPGAPGDRHTWAPADKHGFLTAHQRGGNAYATLRQASLSEVYFPDLSTPAVAAAGGDVVLRGARPTTSRR